MSKNSSSTVAAGCFLIVVGLVVGTLANAFALATLWKWFVVTTFGAPSIGYAQALGLSLVVGAFTKTKETKDDTEKYDSVLEAAFVGAVTAVMIPALYIFIGWIITLFI